MRRISRVCLQGAQFQRFLSGSGLSQGENEISSKLYQALSASLVQVKDTSGGCGAFYSVLVVSERFKGKRLLEQHRMVKEALKEEVKDIHGLTIVTKVPLDSEQDESK